METSFKDLNSLREFIAWKKDHPEEYKELLQGIKDVSRDLLKVMEELNEELE